MPNLEDLGIMTRGPECSFGTPLLQLHVAAVAFFGSVLFLILFVPFFCVSYMSPA